MNKKVLWVSRHVISAKQEDMLISLHGKKVGIFKEEIRFKSPEECLCFIEEKSNDYFVYLTIPKEWQKQAREIGLSFGIIHKPFTTKNQGKKRIGYHIEFHLAGFAVRRKKIFYSLGSKGFKVQRTK